MKITVKMTARDLFQFSMHTSYSGFSGGFNIIFSIAAILGLILGWGYTDDWQKFLLAICACVFTIVQPVMLHFKSKAQAAQTGFSTPINLTLTDEKIAVEQAGVEGEFGWNQVWETVRTKTMFIIKTGPTHGYLIPNASVEGREQELIDIFKRNLPPKKTKGLKA